MSPDRLVAILINQRNLVKRDSTMKYMTNQINEINPVNQAVNSDSVSSLDKRCICVSTCYYIVYQNINSEHFSLYMLVFVVVLKFCYLPKKYSDLFFNA